MPQFEERYDPARVDFIRSRLQRDAGKGKARDYEIIVDGFKVVPRTNDIEEFDDFEEALQEGTRSISILLYDGPGTNRNTRYKFNLSSTAAEPKSGLGDLEGVIAQKIADRDKDHELTRLRGDLEDLEGQLEDAEQYAKELQNRILQMENEGKSRMLKLGDVGASILMGVLRNSAQGSPGKALAGLLGVDDTSPQVHLGGDQPVEGAASYQRQAPDLDEMTQSRVALLESMQHRLNEPQMNGALNILGHLTDSPQRIPEVLQFLEPQIDPNE